MSSLVLLYLHNIILNYLILPSYYSTYGHVEKLAQEIKKGAESVEGVEVKLWQVGGFLMFIIYSFKQF